MNVLSSDSASKASERTPECIPSAPTTRSNVRGAAFWNVTCTPCGVSSTEVIQSPNRYSVSFLVAS
jgi:hypothetical protein